jgi:hypothetical protein
MLPAVISRATRRDSIDGASGANEFRAPRRIVELGAERGPEVDCRGRSRKLARIELEIADARVVAPFDGVLEGEFGDYAVRAATPRGSC